MRLEPTYPLGPPGRGAAAPRLAPRFCPTCAAKTSHVHCTRDATPTIPAAWPPEAVAEPAYGRVVGGAYALGTQIGTGGMGVVFDAAHVVSGQRVAIKFLKPAVLRTRAGIYRLAHEARLSRLVRSPRVARTVSFDFDPKIGGPFLTMELLHGHSLDALIRTRWPFPLPTALRMLRDLAYAIADIHAADIVHRDIKPKNIMMQRGEGPRLTVIDFGLATGPAPNALTKTATDLVAGTLSYMSPEQLRGPSVDHRSDLYAFGCVLHEIFTAEPPHAGAEIMGHVGRGRWPHYRKLEGLEAAPTSIRCALEALHRRLLQASVDLRPPCAKEVGQTLDRLLRPAADGLR